MTRSRGRAYGAAVPVDVLSETVIGRPRDEVARYAADPSNAPEWYENIHAAEWRTPPPLGVGSMIDFEARFLGRRLSYTYEVVEHVPGERLVMRTADGPFAMETTYTWEALGPTTTRMTLRNRGKPSGFGAVAAPALAAAMRRANRKDLARVKAVLEA
jgi:Polyketide cyclase / dehydrase and lipid transport